MCLTGVAGFEPAKPLGRLFEGQPALTFCIHPHIREQLAGAARFEQACVPLTGAQGWSLPHCLYATPLRDARGETRTLTVHVLSMPPLPAWATRASDARGGSRTRTETLFERATSAVWVTRALRRTDTGGGIRTLMSRLLTTVCQPFAPLPRAMLEGGLEPPSGLNSPGALNAVRLPFTPHQPKLSL